MRAWLARRLIALQGAYFICLFGWALLYLLFEDRWFWLFALNTFSLYLFLPLLAIPLTAAFTRRPRMLVCAAAGLALGAHLYGEQFLPRPPPAEASGPALTVMSYNVLGSNDDTAAVLATIRAANADLVALQEPDPHVAEAIARELAAEYPYQVLDPRPGVDGMGAISRYPLRLAGELPALGWVGKPQVLTLDWQGTTVAVLNVHTTSGIAVRFRETQARAMTEYVATHPGPAVVTADFNSTDHSTAYRLMTERLRDVWRDAGSGPGHTWPGADPAGGAAPNLLGLPIPQWLIRIDFVFYTPHWTATAARLGQWDGSSDHRPIVAELRLVDGR